MKKGNLSLARFPVGSYQCNCSVIFSNSTREAIIIDPGNDHEFILNKIKTLNIIPKKLLHTHAHFDHIGRSKEVKEATGASLHLHRGDQFLYDMLEVQGQYFGQNVGKPLPIDHYIEDGETFSFENSIDDPEINNFLKTIHTPGHTPGSCCFYSEYFDLPMLFSGDTLFQNSIGRTDLPGGDSRLIIKSIKDRLLNLPSETLVTPGHGGETRIYEEKKYNPFLC